MLLSSSSYYNINSESEQALTDRIRSNPIRSVSRKKEPVFVAHTGSIREGISFGGKDYGIVTCTALPAALPPS
jgi:hypothetical protein